MDLCTVVFRDELEILQTQARSIARWLHNIDRIYVVVNDSPDIAKQIDCRQWQQYQDRVHVIDRDAFGTDWCDNGWVSQQVLKLAMTAESKSQWCVALDAKTIFVAPLPEIEDMGRVCVGTMPVYPVFEPSRQIVNNLWHIDLQQQLGPGGVPFWFSPKEVRSMIADIEARTQQNFVSWFQAQGRLTEFILYSGWMEYRYGLDFVAAPNKVHPCNICHSEVASADRKLEEMQSSHTVSVHRHAWSAMTKQQQNSYIDFLRERLSP